MNIITRSTSYYLDSFRGFKKEIWWLTLATLVNRAGTMVIPFLSLYLTSSLHFSLGQVGWIMTFFGLGSFVGSWLGGEMTHRWGAYRTMILSLLSSGVFFLVLGQLQGFWGLCTGMFVIALLSDIFRPAVFVAVTTYAKPENRIRAITLIRLAINLGFSLGPAIGGLIIVYASYTSLFWIDGLSAIFAGLVIIFSIVEKKTIVDASKKDNRHSHLTILADKRYMAFLIALLLFAMLFVQYFSTIPVYYKTIKALTEDQVGWLLSMNGLIIFLVEMPVIFTLDKWKSSPFNIMFSGAILLGASFLILLLTGWLGVLVIGMVLATFAEMLCFPFSNNYAIQRGGIGNEGRYMAYYTMTFSLGHILGHNLGMHVSDYFGFDMLFSIMTIMALTSGLMFWFLGIKEKKKNRI